MRTITQTAYERALTAAIREITSALDRALNLEHLASTACLSVFHFHRMFRGLAGETPLEMHRRLRLERAAWQLLDTDAPVTRIAFDAGYETHEAFTRAFRASYDCTPSRFRESRAPYSGFCRGTFRPQLANPLGIHHPCQPSMFDGLFIQTGDCTMEVDIRELPMQRIATFAHQGPYNRINEAFARLGEIAGLAGLFGPQTSMLAIYHDDPETTPANELRSAAALVVDRDTPLPALLGEQFLPAGRYACTVHTGSYALLGDTWARFMGQWLPRSGHRIGNGASFERYLNTPMDVPVEQLRTELYIHLES